MNNDDKICAKTLLHTPTKVMIIDENTEYIPVDELPDCLIEYTSKAAKRRWEDMLYAET